MRDCPSRKLMLIAGDDATKCRHVREAWAANLFAMELGRPRGASKQVRIEQVPLARLAFALLHQRFTGTLQLDQPEPGGSRTIWISGGMPVFTDWVSPVHP